MKRRRKLAHIAMHDAKQDQEKNTKKSKKRVFVEVAVEGGASVSNHLKKRRSALKNNACRSAYRGSHFGTEAVSRPISVRDGARSFGG